MGAAVRFPLGAAVTSRGQARHETDEQLDALREERGGKKHLNSLRACRIFDEIQTRHCCTDSSFFISQHTLSSGGRA